MYTVRHIVLCYLSLSDYFIHSQTCLQRPSRGRSISGLCRKWSLYTSKFLFKINKWGKWNFVFICRRSLFTSALNLQLVFIQRWSLFTGLTVFPSYLFQISVGVFFSQVSENEEFEDLVSFFRTMGLFGYGVFPRHSSQYHCLYRNYLQNPETWGILGESW